MDIEQTRTDVRAAVARVEESDEAAGAARLALQRVALRGLLAVGGDADRQRELVRWLYWDVPALAVKTIEAVIGNGAAVRALAGPGPALRPCEDCGAERRATSRTHLASGETRCRPCEARRLKEERAALLARWPDPPPTPREDAGVLAASWPAPWPDPGEPPDDPWNSDVPGRYEEVQEEASDIRP